MKVTTLLLAATALMASAVTTAALIPPPTTHPNDTTSNISKHDFHKRDSEAKTFWPWILAAFGLNKLSKSMGWEWKTTTLRPGDKIVPDPHPRPASHVTAAPQPPSPTANVVGIDAIQNAVGSTCQTALARHALGTPSWCHAAAAGTDLNLTMEGNVKGPFDTTMEGGKVYDVVHASGSTVDYGVRFHGVHVDVGYEVMKRCVEEVWKGARGDEGASADSAAVCAGFLREGRGAFAVRFFDGAGDGSGGVVEWERGGKEKVVVFGEGDVDVGMVGERVRVEVEEKLRLEEEGRKRVEEEERKKAEAERKKEEEKKEVDGESCEELAAKWKKTLLEWLAYGQCLSGRRGRAGDDYRNRLLRGLRGGN
ncbi:hypothetical protein FKW77_009457 [Venturia effusa]|uniref:Ecp2 effector protein domain-containing protein n=1 Tax=Venturia effusa TaxID=50376 RepID=A0A517KXA4_9PEZI|nr:hypothetical protein FKW77_009457 [Venturia effusa]